MEMVMENIKPAWLGNFPLHWEVRRIKNIFREIDLRSETGKEELLSVSQYTGITPTRESLESENEHITNAKSLKGYKKVSKGDLAVNIMLAWNGSLGISAYDGIVSPAYCVYRCNPEYNSEYFGHLFSTNLFKSEFRRNSTGIIDSRLRLYSDIFFSIYSVVPPREEQDEIVTNIKQQIKKINHFIREKRQFIELLKEQKQSIIMDVVLEGVGKNRRMKVSGINLLGDIPSNWEIKKIKHLFREIDNRSENGNEELLSVSHYKGVIPRKQNLENENDILTNAESLKGYKLVEKGDFVMNIMLAWNGSFGVSQYKGITSPAYCVYRCITKDNPEYFSYLFSTNVFKGEFRRNSTGIIDSRLRLYPDKFFRIFSLVPPIDEQNLIIQHIKSETRIIDIAIAKAEKEIELIKEYKEAMIAEVVMGKRNK